MQNVRSLKSMGEKAKLLSTRSKKEIQAALALATKYQGGDSESWHFKHKVKNVLSKDLCFSANRKQENCRRNSKYNLICVWNFYSTFLLDRLLSNQCGEKSRKRVTPISSSKECEKAVKGWDFTVIIKENELNKILPKVFATRIFPNKLKTFEHVGKVTSLGQSWKTRSTFIFSNLVISELILRVREGQGKEGKLEVTFSSGQLRISKKLLGFEQNLPPNVQDFSLINKTFKFRIKVVAHNIAKPADIQDIYSVKLELDDYNTFIGHVDIDDLSIFDATDVADSLTVFIRQSLFPNTNQFELTTFTVPLKYPDQEEVAKNLFPRTIPLAWTFAPHGEAYITAVGTTQICLSCGV